MNVLIAGGGSTGAQLAISLIKQKHQVTIIENDRSMLTHLHRHLPTEAIYEGNAMQLQTLEQAGVRQADVLVACTSSDTDNLLLCNLARKLYQVRRTMARVNDPSHAWLFDQKFSVDVALNESNILAHLIEEEMSLGDMMTLLKLQRGKYSLVEVRIPEGTIATGRAIKDLALPNQCVIAGIIRKNELILPRGITALEVGDEVLALTDQQGEAELQKLFSNESANETLSS